MREDMYKVVINRPRYASRFGTKTKLRYLGDEDLPHRITGKQVLHYKKDAMHKHFNDHVMPLNRYLFSQRGRKWDDVFSEICEHLDTGSTVKMHVHEHIDGFIMRKVRVDENGHYWGHSWGPESPDRWSQNLYVCPHDDLIKETKILLQELGLKSRHDLYRQKRRKQFRARTYKNSFRRLNDTVFLVVCNGIWYRFETTALPVHNDGRALSDGSIRDSLRRSSNIDRDLLDIRYKQQLSKKELKKHGLKNGGTDV